VSFDFAFSVVPGWHSTVFPPYFVAGALFAGFAMVLLIAIPLRKIYNLEDFITMRHIRNMAIIMLVSGLGVSYGYLTEIFTGWYSANPHEIEVFRERFFTGPLVWAAWIMIFCNVVAPQVIWFRRFRSNTVAIWIVSLLVSIGMWFERFIIIVQSLSRNNLPSSWNEYMPTFWDMAMFTGTIGFFMFLLLLFIRFLPVISIFEMRELLSKTDAQEGHNV
jgi:Ni/Fe-hydrogenase subunit HybB-like protein